MSRRLSAIGEAWWDYTTLDEEILEDAGRLSEKDILELSRPGFKVKFYESLETLYDDEIRFGESRNKSPVEFIQVFFKF